MKKIIKRALTVFAVSILIIALVYVCNIDNIPNNIVIFEGEALRINTIPGVEVETEFSSNPNIERIENNETITVSAMAENTEDIDCTGIVNLSIKFFGKKVKEVSVNVIENTEVVPVGKVIGVKLYTNGVLVVGMSEIAGPDKNNYKPYEGSGIEEGDVIVRIDDREITSTAELMDKINSSKDSDMKVTYIRKRKDFKYNFECSKG